MKLTIIRHGQTTYNEKNLLNATIDTNLTKKGELQATITGKYLNKKFNKIYSSPRIRTKETTKLITNNNKNIIIDENLIERDYGIFEAKPYLEVKEQLKNSKPEDNKKYKIEQIEKFQKRIKQFIQTNILKKENLGKQILIVSHSGTIKMLIYQLIKSDQNYKQFKNSIKLNNCSITTIEFETIDKIKSQNIGFDKHLKELK